MNLYEQIFLSFLEIVMKVAVITGFFVLMKNLFQNKKKYDGSRREGNDIIREINYHKTMDVPKIIELVLINAYATKKTDEMKKHNSFEGRFDREFVLAYSFLENIDWRLLLYEFTSLYTEDGIVEKVIHQKLGTIVVYDGEYEWNEKVSPLEMIKRVEQSDMVHKKEVINKLKERQQEWELKKAFLPL